MNKTKNDGKMVIISKLEPKHKADLIPSLTRTRVKICVAACNVSEILVNMAY